MARKHASLHSLLADASEVMLELCWQKTHLEIARIYDDPAARRIWPAEELEPYDSTLLFRQHVDLGLRDVDAVLMARLKLWEIEGLTGIRVVTVITQIQIETDRPLAEIVGELKVQANPDATLLQVLEHPFIVETAKAHPVVRGMLLQFSIEQPKFHYNISRELEANVVLGSVNDPESDVVCSLMGTSGLFAILDKEHVPLDPEFKPSDVILEFAGDDGPWPLEDYRWPSIEILESASYASPPDGYEFEETKEQR